ncbi:WbqC family protein [Bradyrhizobium sp. JYMT SZCCT0428]|uniref:WbqC family protein n=1 Tax=Bradyrhizobium sp. JYMT SZCCT0428 TaxID=2807673 RepID=UPI001BABFAF8|nr:WbqC family protein [Bradyrhizobium sp. JYMT SZCCT0428]MBR1156121.1 WbqC family protein [Bradyrhizobium sp. JYMT SZCCT0428]
MLIAIHQPNFFPWLGYFDKIRRADVFIFLDNVDYPRKGSGGMGSWVNRVQLCVQGKAKWVTCPVKRASLGTRILAVEIDDGQVWRTKLQKTLTAGYGRAPHFNNTMTLLQPLFESPEGNLATFNISAIKVIAAYLGIATQFLRQSELAHQGSSTRLLISLVKAAGGKAYLAGGGAAGYQEDEIFAEEGIQLVYQRFMPRPYGDPTRFLPGLSIIDYLMHDGRPLEEVLTTTEA